MAKRGYKVGVLDADITGPSMPRFFGVHKKRAEIIPLENSKDVRFVPVETEKGIKLISINLLIQNEADPVLWRGSLINSMLTQMFTDTEWGELDYLFVDMPPGTGDTALTVMQSFPIDSMLIVATPQDMVSMIVKKVVTMAEKLNISLLGVVENMSYVKCTCGEKIKIFSKRTGEEHANYIGLPLVAELPIDLDLIEAVDEGKGEEYIMGNDAYNDLFKF
jgi:Mrp family chromosome partitioning ATPase